MSQNTNPNLPQRQRTETRTTVRISQRQRLLLIGGAISTLVILLIVLFYNSMKTTPGKAAVTNDYRSRASGNWSAVATWERYDGTNWVAATTAPNAGSNEIAISSGHTVVLNASNTADQLIIETGGQLTIASGQTLTLNAGAGTDMVNNGIVSNDGTITLNGGANIAHNAGAQYIHTRNGGAIPGAAWNATSSCIITGMTGTAPGGFPQNFGHLTWNCTGQTANYSINSTTSIQGNFTLASTNSSRINFNTSVTGRTFTIGGNYIQTGGNLRLSDGLGGGNLTISGNCQISGGELMGNNDWGSSTITVSGDFTLSGSGVFKPNSTNTSSTVNINGDLNVTGGTLTVLESGANCTMNVRGDFSATGGTITETGSGTATINFNGLSMQTYTSGSTISNTINFNVNASAYLQMADAGTTVSGGGSFTVSNSGKLGITSTSGIAASGASGNIRVTGTRTFNTGADYEYNGTTAQISGNGLPATVRNLTFNNASGVTISNSINATGLLSMSAGNITTGGNTLTLGTSTSSTGALIRTAGVVIGNFRRWVASSIASNILFPVGTSAADNTFGISFTAAPTGGTITSRFDTGFPGVYGLPITDAGDECITVGSGWWTLNGANGFSGGTMTITARAEGFTGINDYTSLHLFRRDNSASAWDANGTHQTPGGNATAPILNRTGVTQLGQFGITSSSANPLPVQLIRFDVKASGENTLISWSTATETNNDYFVVQHSANGRDYTDVKRVDGAGNSNTVKSYSCTHTKPVNGVNYYRLRQVDMNGTEEIFGPKTLNFRKENKTTVFTNLTASPNPFSSNLSLQFESAFQGSTPLRIFSAAGKEVFSGNIDVETGNNNIYLPLADQLNPGSYVILIGDDKDASRIRVVKQ